MEIKNQLYSFIVSIWYCQHTIYSNSKSSYFQNFFTAGAFCISLRIVMQDICLLLSKYFMNIYSFGKGCLFHKPLFKLNIVEKRLYIFFTNMLSILGHFIQF